MRYLPRLTAVAALLGTGGYSHAALVTATGPVAFNGTASVTATASGVTSAANSNNNATAATVSLPQFDASLGVLTGVELGLNSSRTQTIQGGGNKNNGPGRTASGSGTSTAALTAPGVSAAFTPALAQAGGSCSLAQGPTGPISCTWGPNTSAATATSATATAEAANLGDWVGGGTASASLAMPSLQATTTLSSVMGQAGSGSNTTYSVAWSGSVEASYTYLLHAAPSFDGGASQTALDLDFGTVAQGSGPTHLAFSLYNLADPNRAGLDLDSVSPGTGDTDQLTTDLGTLSNMAQGSSEGFLAYLDTTTAGLFSAEYILNLSDADVGAAGSRNNYQLTLNLSGNVAPVPVPAAVWLFGSALAGLVGLGRRGRNQASA